MAIDNDISSNRKASSYLKQSKLMATINRANIYRSAILSI